MPIPSPTKTANDCDRHVECGTAIEQAMAFIEKNAVEAGWKEIEIAIAIADYGRMRLQAILDQAEKVVTHRKPH